MRRSLPSSQEALAILAARRPRPAPRPPRHAARGLTTAMKKLEEKFGRGPDDLKARWKEIVGEALAGRSEPVKLVKSRTGGATLELRVAGPVAALVQHQAPLILDRLNLYLGPGTVAKLRIVQGPLSKPPSASTAAPKRRSRAPLDAAAERELAIGLAEAPDGPLKDALLRLGREVLRSQTSLPFMGRDRPRSGQGGDV
ncbi:MAG: DciA family protein [Caulobacteraceae bacterium]